MEQNNDKDLFEVTLEKSFFGLKHDIKITFVYASPINSCYTKSRSENVIDIIETKMIDKNSNYLLMGDFNGRTKTAQDFVNDTFDNHSPVNNPLQYMPNMRF